MAVAFEELEGSPRLHIDHAGTRAVRLFRVAWTDWQDFSRELLGTYRRVGCAYRFEPPLSFPGLSDVVVTNLAVEPFDGGNPEGSAIRSITSGTNAYPVAGAKITVTYESLLSSTARSGLPSVPDGTYLTYQADLGADFLSVPGRIWKWEAPPDDPKLPPDINPGLLLPTDTYRITWHRVAAPNWEAIRSLRGKTNDVTFMGAAAGTVLFLGARVSRQFQFGGDDGFWQVEYSFAEKSIELSGGGKAGWNHFYKEEAVGGENWVEIKDGSGNKPYKSGSLASLFAFETC